MGKLGRRIKTTEQFIEDAICKRGYNFNYKHLTYTGALNKVVIVCLKCKCTFEQVASEHLRVKSCPKCYQTETNNHQWSGAAHTFNLPTYTAYSKKLKKYQKVFKVNKLINSTKVILLGVKCHYCSTVFIPKADDVYVRLSAINGKRSGSRHLYCSDSCKQNCPTFNQKIWPKGFKIDTSREVQPQLRKMRFEIDDYKCQVCFVDNNLHCHHYEGVEINPIESADLDKCITICKECHKDLHRVPGYTYQDYKRKKCKS